MCKIRTWKKGTKQTRKSVFNNQPNKFTTNKEIFTLFDDFGKLFKISFSFEKKCLKKKVGCYFRFVNTHYLHSFSS